MIFICLIIGALVAIINKKLSNPNLSIFFVFNFSWLITIILYQLNLSVFPPLSFELKLYLIAFLLCYITSYYIVRKFIIGKVYLFVSNVDFDRAKVITDFLLLLWFLFLLYFFYQIRSIGGILEYLSDGGARTALKDLSEDSGVNISFYLFGTLFIIARLYLIFLNIKKQSYSSFMVIIVVLASMLLTAAKINFMYCVMLIYFCWFNAKNKKTSLLFIHSVGILGLMYVFIVAFSFFTGKVVDSNVGSMNDFSDVFLLGGAALLYPYDYVVGSLAALDYFIMNQYVNSSEFFVYTFSRVYKVAIYFFGKDAFPTIPAHSLPFVSISGVSTNVYSMHYELINDFGFFGALISSIALAALNSFLDFNFKKSKSLFVYILFYLSLVCSALSTISLKYTDTIYLISFIFLFIAPLVRGVKIGISR